ncbi:MAG: SDR family NAD(P)-dependent oxidoreductase [Myxococcales bacterium]|nr:SDR family NAD(P)-dependent oxidoreductase [Myxococcales bacterium]
MQLVDLDPAADAAADLAAALAELLTPDGEDQVAYRGGRLGARLVPVEIATPAAPIAFDPDATWLVTGGLGGVGLELARWLVDRGARHLVLTSRGGLADETRRAAVAALVAAGARVEAPAVDVADAAAMAALIDAIPAERPLRGVFHAAGLTGFGPLVQTTAADRRALLRAKVEGAAALDRLTARHPLEHFVLFSSASATWGAAGLAVYGAANHALDLLAHRRRATGRPALAVDWGGWAGGGMTDSAVAAYGAAMGLSSSAPVELLEALDACMQSGRPRVTVAVVDWPLFKAVLEARGPRPLLAGIEVAAPVQGDGPLARALADLPAAARWAALCDAVAARAAEVLGIADPAALDRDRGFFALGMDSMMSVRLRRAVEVDVGEALPPTVAIEHPTVSALATWLAREVLGVEPGDAIDATDGIDDGTADDSDATDGIDDLDEDDLEALLAAELGDQS